MYQSNDVSKPTDCGRILDFLEVDVVDGVICSFLLEELSGSRAVGLQVTTSHKFISSAAAAAISRHALHTMHTPILVCPCKHHAGGSVRLSQTTA